MNQLEYHWGTSTSVNAYIRKTFNNTLGYLDYWTASNMVVDYGLLHIQRPNKNEKEKGAGLYFSHD